MSNTEKAKELEIEAINYRQNKCFFPVTMTYDQIMECAKQVELGYRAGYQLGQSQQPDIKQDFQYRVLEWLLKCFGAKIAADILERNDRFIEEALELAQSLNYSADRAHALVDYVFGRPKGEPFQEVGGVMVTLAALCSATGLNMMMDGEVEYARINTPKIIEKIRKKQASKPTGSALPIPNSTTATKTDKP